MIKINVHKIFDFPSSKEISIDLNSLEIDQKIKKISSENMLPLFMF